MRKLVYFALFVIGLTLIITGHQMIGPVGLLIMLVGLSFQIGLLWIYNQSYK